jgi:PAS domain S-box-containing protein
MKTAEMPEGFLDEYAARTFLLGTGPVLAFQLDGESRLVEANRLGRRLLGEQAIGCPLPERLLNLSSPLEFAALAAGGDTTHRLTMSSVSGLPETFYFRFFPLSKGTLALASADFEELQTQRNELLALNHELNQRSGRLHKAHHEIQDLLEAKKALTKRLSAQSETQREQTLASLNLMEDAVAARQRAEQAAEALRASEARGRAVFDNAPDAALIVYPGGQCVELNAITLPRYGYSREEFMTMTPADLAVPELAAEFAELVDRGFQCVTRFESRHKRKDGSAFPVDVTASPLVLDGVTCVLCVLKDSTQRKQADEALNRSELRCRGILEAAPDPIVVIDQAAKMILVNAAAERVFGYPRSELLGHSVSLVISSPLPLSGVSRQLDSLDVSAAQPANPVIEGHAVRKDGVAIPVEIRLSKGAGSEDEGLQIVLAIRDLSGIRRAEATLRKLLEAAPDALVVANGSGQIVLVNTETERIFGYPEESLLGQDIDLLFPESVRQERAELWEACAVNPQKQNLVAASELIASRQDGSEFPIEVSLRLFETEEGALVLSAIRDVTERKKEEQRSRHLEIKAAEAEAASRAKSRFLSTMSHEIRTPMNAVLGYSQLMLRDPDLGANAKANLKIINRSGEYLLKMIDDILDLAKIEAGRLELVARTFHLPSLLLDLEAMFRLPAGAKGLQLAAAVAGGERVEYLKADEGRIRQVLINLLSNAIKFTERGRINLQVSLEYREGEQLWLSAGVADTGLGMTVEEQGRLFRPFVQGKASHHARQTGTGLGLVIAQEMARLMGGDITVSSTPGVGSDFLFEIPVAPASRAGFRGRRIVGNQILSLEAEQQAPRILVVDDLNDNREWLCKLLTAVGFQVRSAEDGAAAIQIWQEWDPQLMLMDIHMPVMSGLEATKRIRSHPSGKNTVIIALTADAMDDNRRTVLEHDMSDFISKPCAERELLEKIGTHLGVAYRPNDAAAAGKGEAAAAADPEQLRLLPAALLERLQQATRCGDKALLDELILTIGDEGDPQSAQTLQELADSYQYDLLIQLLEEACPH